jgi:hypothetical protein
MFTTEIRVGRLYEHRILELDSPDEIARLGARAREVMTSHPGNVVVCADFRFVKFVRHDLVEQFVKAISQVNPKVERSGVLITGEQAIFNLQIKRMVREMGHPGRQVFKDVAALRAWLGEKLIAEELARLDAFLQVHPN